jgi:hypothetical protein
MVMSSLGSRGGIFISYRREETAANAGRLYDRLSDRFGEDHVFMDVDSIAIGTDFTRAIAEAVSGCDILLALIGKQWSAITDSEGRRRLDDPADFVRIEIETALQRNIRVVPILVDGAVLPRADELPQSLRSLTLRQALELTHANFRLEMPRLVAAVAEAVDGEHAADDRGTGVLTLTRAPGGLKDRGRAYQVVVDNSVIGKIRKGEQLDLPLASGRHVIYLKVDWCRSRELEVDMRPGGSVKLGCKPGAVQGLWQREGYIELFPVATGSAGG